MSAEVSVDELNNIIVITRQCHLSSVIITERGNHNCNWCQGS